MDKLKAMQTFVAIAEHGSLTAAALALGFSLPATVRALAALETHLGARLFQRTTRRIRARHADGTAGSVHLVLARISRSITTVVQPCVHRHDFY